MATPRKPRINGTSDPDDMPVIGLNLGLFGAILFTGSPTPYLACHILGHGGKLGVIDTSMCKRRVPASETGKRLVLRVWLVIVGFEVWVRAKKA